MTRKLQRSEHGKELTNHSFKDLKGRIQLGPTNDSRISRFLLDTEKDTFEQQPIEELQKHVGPTYFPL